jgi:hypothetical protein
MPDAPPTEDADLTGGLSFEGLTKRYHNVIELDDIVCRARLREPRRRSSFEQFRAGEIAIRFYSPVSFMRAVVAPGPELQSSRRFVSMNARETR